MAPSLIATMLKNYNSSLENGLRNFRAGSGSGASRGSKGGSSLETIPKCTLLNFDSDVPIELLSSSHAESKKRPIAGSASDITLDAFGTDSPTASVRSSVAESLDDIFLARRSSGDGSKSDVALNHVRGMGESPAIGYLQREDSRPGEPVRHSGNTACEAEGMEAVTVKLFEIDGTPLGNPVVTGSEMKENWIATNCEIDLGGAIDLNSKNDDGSTKDVFKVAQAVIHMENGTSKLAQYKRRSLADHDETCLHRNLVVKTAHYLFGIGLFFSLLSCWTLSTIYRLVVRLVLFVLYNSKVWLIERPMDAIWAYEVHNSSSNIVFVLRCAGQPDLDRIVDDFEKKVLKHRTLMKVAKGGGDKNAFYKMHTPYEKLTWIIKEKFLFYCWQRDSDFNIRNHFFMEKVMDEGENLEERIQAVCEAYLECQLDKSRPQWEFRVIAPVGGEGSRSSDYGLIFCVHHTYGDGLSWMQMFSQCFADEVVPLPFDPLKSPPGSECLEKSWAGNLCCKMATAALLPHAFASQVVHMMEEKHEFHGPLAEGNKNCRWSHKSVPLDYIKALQMEHKSHPPQLLFTSILLAAATAAARRTLENVQASIPFQVLAGVPYASLPYESLEPVNNFTMALFPLPTRIARKFSPARMWCVNDIVHEHSTKLKIQLNNILTNICGSLITPFMKLSVTLAARGTMAVSNLPGPKRTMTLFGGHTVNNFLLFPPLKYRTGVIMGVLSYDDFVSLSVTADAKITQKHPMFATTFLQFVQQELYDMAGSINNNHHDPKEYASGNK